VFQVRYGNGRNRRQITWAYIVSNYNQLDQFEQAYEDPELVMASVPAGRIASQLWIGQASHAGERVWGTGIESETGFAHLVWASNHMYVRSPEVRTLILRSLAFPGGTARSASTVSAGGSACPAIDLTGNWRAAPYLGTSILRPSRSEVVLRFQFDASGWYSYVVTEGAMEWLRHRGRYSMISAGKEEQRQGYRCVVNLTPEPSTVLVNNENPYGLATLVGASLPAKQPISYRLYPNGATIIVQHVEQAPSGVSGTWTLRMNK
jgi:hypothetical protein